MLLQFYKGEIITERWDTTSLYQGVTRRICFSVDQNILLYSIMLFWKWKISGILLSKHGTSPVQISKPKLGGKFCLISNQSAEFVGMLYVHGFFFFFIVDRDLNLLKQILKQEFVSNVIVKTYLSCKLKSWCSVCRILTYLHADKWILCLDCWIHADL